MYMQHCMKKGGKSYQLIMSTTLDLTYNLSIKIIDEMKILDEIQEPNLMIGKLVNSTFENKAASCFFASDWVYLHQLLKSLWCICIIVLTHHVLVLQLLL